MSLAMSLELRVYLNDARIWAEDGHPDRIVTMDVLELFKILSATAHLGVEETGIQHLAQRFFSIDTATQHL